MRFARVRCSAFTPRVYWIRWWLTNISLKPLHVVFLLFQLLFSYLCKTKQKYNMYHLTINDNDIRKENIHLYRNIKYITMKYNQRPIQIFILTSALIRGITSHLSGREASNYETNCTFNASRNPRLFCMLGINAWSIQRIVWRMVRIIIIQSSLFFYLHISWDFDKF